MLKYLLAVLCVAPAFSQALPPEAQSLLDLAKAANPVSYQYVVDKGASILPTSDSRSFYLYTAPQSGRPIVVSIAAGPNSWATDEFSRWHPDSSFVGMGVLTIQAPDTYSAADIHRELRAALRAAGAAEGSILLNGGQPVFEVTALDRQTKDRYYALSVSSGSPGDLSSYGFNILSGTYWALACADCVNVRDTVDQVMMFGGITDAFVRDLQDPANLRYILYVFLTNIAMRTDASLSRSTWNVNRDAQFVIPDASTPNAGYVNGEVRLTIGGQKLYRSADGSNASSPEPIAGVAQAMAGTGYTATEMVPRQDAIGQPVYYVLALAPPGTNRSLIYRLVQNVANGLVRAPSDAVFAGGSFDVGVPDISPALDGGLRLTYVALGAARSNARTAISYDGGITFYPDFNNPFGDLGIPDAKPTDINVDPAILKLSTGGYLAVTMRDRKLYLFTSVDARTFTPVDQPPIEPSLFDAQGLYDPTLVQLPDGRIWMYVTADSRVVRAELTRIN